MNLPEEFLLRILLEFTYRQLLELRVLSRKFKDFIDAKSDLGNEFWRLKNQFDFNIDYSYPKQSYISYKKYIPDNLPIELVPSVKTSKNWLEEYISNLRLIEAPKLVNAVLKGNIELVKELLDFGVSSNTRSKILFKHFNKNFKNPSVLMLASYYGYSDIVDILLYYKARIDFVDYEGNTALAYTIIGANQFRIVAGYSDIVDKLLLAGSNVNWKTKNGDTLLILISAGLSENRNIIAERLLKVKEIDLNSLGTNNWSALDWAIYRNNVEIAELIKKAGGKSVSDIIEIVHET